MYVLITVNPLIDQFSRITEMTFDISATKHIHGEHHVFPRKVRFLLRFKNSDNLICSLFLNNASSEIKLICKKYSANVNNIYTCIRRAAFGT